MADPPPYPGAPRWVTVAGIIVIALVLLVVILLVTGIGGPHGPGRHMPTSDTGGDAPPNLTDRATPSGGGPAGQRLPLGGY